MIRRLIWFILVGILAGGPAWAADVRASGITSGSAINWAHPLNRGLIAWWLALPGHDGPRFLDLRRRNPGTLLNGAAWKGPQRPGGWGSIGFDGSNDYVDIADATNLHLQLPFSISMWLYIESPGSYSGLYVAADAWSEAGAQVALEIYDVGTARVRLYSGGTTAGTSGNTLTTGVWIFVGVTASASATTYYVDRTVNAVGAAGDPLWATTPSTKLGAFVDGSGGCPCRIDDVRVADRVLSTDEMSQLYTLSRQSYPGVLHRHEFPFAKALAAAAVSAQRMLLLGVGP